MFKLTLLVVLATTGFFQLTTGSPAASIPSRRDSSEGVYLSNCNVVDAGILYSEMDYYSNAKTGSQNGQQPNDTTDAIQPMNAYVAWEGNQVCGTFINSGETFCSNIVSNGQSLATGAFAGTGFNNQTQFNCFKDDGGVLYSGTESQCYSIYYCFDA